MRRQDHQSSEKLPAAEKLYGNVTLHAGDCREVLKSLKSNSVDSVVTDPPYHLVSIAKRFTKTSEDDDNKTGRAAKERSNEFARLSRGFMNQTWDGGDIAYQVDLWKEVLRVLKPGGHLLSFGGTRTYHRMACAIEDAGFEIRDQIQWIYGTGFPKSQNVARMMDKELGVKGKFGEFKTEEHSNISKRSKMRGDWGQEGWQRPWMNDPEALENYSRKYIPASKEGLKFDGFGTGLKPSAEPVCVARKPLSERTVAANVLKWGTGALNVDGCRIETAEEITTGQGTSDRIYGGGKGLRPPEMGTQPFKSHPDGRWPANVIHDGSEEVVGMFPDSISQGGDGYKNSMWCGGKKTGGHGLGDSGSAARFFYSSKADKDNRFGSKHPTIKNVDLIRYLIRLVTPKGGLVLDPFAGSGTTGEAAFLENMQAVLIERESEYCEDIRRRMKWVKAHPDDRAYEIAKASGETERQRRAFDDVWNAKK